MSNGPSDWDDDWDDGDRPRPRRRATASPARARTFGLPIVAAALIGGLFVGYVVSSGGGGTTTITQTKTVTAPSAEVSSGSGIVPSGEATRATISLAVLNGSGENGLAAGTAEDARQIGYEEITEGNAPSLVSASMVLHRQGAGPRAARVAEDLGLPEPELATADDPALAAAPDADVVVVLGPSGAASAGVDDGTAAAPDTTDTTGTSTSPTG